MPTRIYEPPPDPSSTDIETEVAPDGSRRQVVRAPQVEAAILTAQQVITKTGNVTKSLADLHAALVGVLVANVSMPDAITSGTITTADIAGGGATPTAGSFVRHTESGGDSSFSVSVQGATGNYSFVFERSINFGTVGTPQEVWTAVSAFQAGTPFIKSTWTQADAVRAPLEFHGNISSSSRLRIRFTQLGSSNPTIVIRSSAGTGTITVGNPLRIADSTTPSQQLKVNPVGSAHVVATEPAGGNPAISIAEYAQLRTRLGQVFSASSGRQEAGAVGSTTIKMLLQNPAGSGKTMYVFHLSLFASAQMGYFSFLINPTANLPTTQRTANNHFVGHPNVAVGKAFADVGAAMTGGSDSGIVIPVPSGGLNQLDLDAPYVLSPGVSLAIQATFTAATSVIVTGDWLEE